MKQRVFGYIVRDQAGVVAIFPDFANDPLEEANNALKYARENVVLETITKRRDEDEIDFKLRLHSLAREWIEQKKHKYMN